MILAITGFIAVALTYTMFQSRQSMLGFPCALFWAIFGGQAYLSSTTPWGDIYYYLAFSSLFGMTIFSMLAAYGLREIRDTLGDEAMEEEEEEREGEGEPEMGDEASGAKKQPTARERLKKRREERENKRMGRFRR